MVPFGPQNGIFVWKERKLDYSGDGNCKLGICSCMILHLCLGFPSCAGGDREGDGFLE